MSISAEVHDFFTSVTVKPRPIADSKNVIAQVNHCADSMLKQMITPNPNYSFLLKAG